MSIMLYFATHKFLALLHYLVKCSDAAKVALPCLLQVSLTLLVI